MDRIKQMQKVQAEALELFKKKNADYGDAFATYGPVGVLVRMEDKLKRFLSVASSGVQLVDNEGVRDTLIDLHNYSAMAIMLMDEPKKEIPKPINLPLCETNPKDLDFIRNLLDYARNSGNGEVIMGGHLLRKINEHLGF